MCANECYDSGCAWIILLICLCSAVAQAPQPPEIEYDFVDEPSRDYYCPVTFELLRDPHQTTCCGHHISVTAGVKLQQEGKLCPMCKEPNFTTQTDKYFKRVVNGLKVRCPHKGSGCEWVEDLGSLDQHTKVCPKRPWQCQYCDFTATCDVGANEHLPQCPKFPEPCPNRCEKGTVERCNLEKHLASECSLQLVACEFSHAGCTEKVPRKDLARHMEDGMQKHLLSMSLLNLSLTRELHQKMDEKDRQIAELQLQLQQLHGKVREQFKQLDGKVERLDGKVREQFQQLDGKVERHFHDLVGSVFTKEFTLTEFNQTRKHGTWCSPSFYSGRLDYGYEFIFNIDFDDPAHLMSVYLYLEKGDHDERLSWPIKCIVCFQILNQLEDRDHIERSASWEWGKPTKDTYQKISDINYSSLTTRTYRKDDNLCCKLHITVRPVLD